MEGNENGRQALQHGGWISLAERDTALTGKLGNAAQQALCRITSEFCSIIGIHMKNEHIGAAKIETHNTIKHAKTHEVCNVTESDVPPPESYRRIKTQADQEGVTPYQMAERLDRKRKNEKQCWNKWYGQDEDRKRRRTKTEMDELRSRRDTPTPRPDEVCVSMFF
jgi:hypothetical protein